MGILFTLFLIHPGSIKSTALNSTISPISLKSLRPNYSLSANNNSTQSPLNTGLQIVNQSSSIQPNQNFNVSIKTTSPNSQSEIFDFYLYNKLNSRSAYYSSLNQPYNLIESSGAITATASDLNFQIDLNAGFSSQNTPNNIYFHLSCRSCLGVYPLKIAQLNPVTRQINSYVITHICVLPATAIAKLNLNIVIPMLFPAGNNVPVASQYFNVSEIQNLSQDLTVLEHYKSLAVNIDLSPEGYLLLKNQTSQSYSQLKKLLQSVLKIPNRLLLSETFAPIDSPQLLTAGLGGDICKQITDGLNVLDNISTNVQSVFSPSENLSEASLSELSKCGISDIILNNKNLTSVSLPFGISEPFNITNSSVIGLEKDTQLTKDMLVSSNPIQQANNIIGDLAQLYYDFPNSTSNRVLNLDLPNNTQINPQFLTALLNGLQNNSVLGTTSATEAATYPVGVLYNPTNRSILNPPISNLTTTTITQAKAIQSGLAQIDQNQISFLPTLTDMSVSEAIDVLESDNITQDQQQQWLSAIQKLVNNLRDQITLPSQQTITITSNTANIPITVLKNDSYNTYLVKIVLKDNGLSFKSGSSRLISISKQQNTLYFSISPRSPGSSVLSVTVESPSGNLILLQQNYTIHSSAFSFLGLLLTAAAGLLIIWWWVKYALNKRRLKGGITAK